MGSERSALPNSNGAGVQADHDRVSISSQLSEAEKVSSPTVKMAGYAEEAECKDRTANGKKRSCLGLKMSHLLCVVIVAVWGLLLLPIIFYHLPPSAAETEDGTANVTHNESTECFVYPTTGGICQAELQNILFSVNCDSGEIPLVLRDEEATASQFINSLGLLNPSPQCEEAVIPFLCLFLFGLCDSSGVSIQPTSGQCEELRDGVCSTEWSTALAIGVDLPDCEIFQSEQAICMERSQNGSGAINTTGGSGSGVGISVDGVTITAPTGALECREDFYREEPEGPCLPSCFTWREHSKGSSIAIDVIVFITALVGFATAVAVIVISLLRRKRMFLFPSVFVVYKTIDLIVMAFFVLVNFTDRDKLYCASKNILESPNMVTPFCVLTGMVFTYTLMQLTVWWLFHTVSLFWKVRYPFHARSFEVAGRIKYIHVACIIGGILIPLVPVIASVADAARDSETTEMFVNRGMGFTVTRFPPILCTGSNSDVVFYSLVLPIDLTLAVGCSLLVVTFWTFHKQHGLFRSKDNSKSVFKFGAAERKLLIVFCYYVLLAAISLTAFTLSTRNLPEMVRLFVIYFNCESAGHNASNPCSRSEFEALSYSTLTSFSFILLGLFPVVNLVYAVNVKELKAYCKCFSRFSNYFSTATSTLNYNSASSVSKV